eukprot:GHVP01036623.1.p1 GENE.GHVP01036623.1~~GHVP01036623.1.p1  ORF type:complete len:220 (+),score=40.42 GHVP01036623.1:38-697(+)
MRFVVKISPEEWQAIESSAVKSYKHDDMLFSELQDTIFMWKDTKKNLKREVVSIQAPRETKKAIKLENPVLSSDTFGSEIFFTTSQSTLTLQNIKIDDFMLKWLSDRLEVKIGEGVEICCFCHDLCLNSVARNGFVELVYECDPRFQQYIYFEIDDNLSNFLSYFDTSRFNFCFKFTDEETVPRMVREEKISFLRSKEVLNLKNRAAKSAKLYSRKQSS